METVLEIVLFGAISGLVGTAVMTIGQYIEIALTKRAPSLTPALIVSKLFRFDLDSFVEKNKWRLNNLVHWSYGVVWGVILAAVYVLFDLHFGTAILVYFFIFWIQGLIVVPMTGVAEPVWKWKAKWIFLDGLFHLVYAIVAAGMLAWILSVA